jgi:putative heme iron utilization protein
MNGDHAEAIGLYLRNLLGRDGEGWRMTGIDPEGCDFRLGGAVARLDFPEPIADAAAARKALVELAHRAGGTDRPPGR